MKKILAVDDSLSALTMLRETLRDDYKVYVVTSGEEALEFLEQETPDLIILDYFMKGIDGLETLERIYNRRRGLLAPVLMLTSISSLALERSARDLGAVAFLPKPVEPEELKRTLRSILLDAVEKRKEKSGRKKKGSQKKGKRDNG